jgi:hypothetical protein
MNMLHRRMRLTAQADGGHRPPDATSTPNRTPCARAPVRRGSRPVAGIVDRVDDRAAANLAKGAARQVKVLQEIDRNGALEADELADLGRLLGHAPPSVEAGRTELADAAATARWNPTSTLLYHWNRLIRTTC